MDNNVNNKQKSKILSLICLSVFVIGLGVTSLTFNSTDTFARSSSFIQQNEYTISFTGFNFHTYDEESSDTTIEDYAYSGGNFYLSFNKSGNVVFSYPTHDRYEDMVKTNSVILPKQTDTRYRLIQDLPFCFFSTYEFLNENPFSEAGVLNYTCTQVDFYNLTGGTMGDFYDRLDYCEGYSYGSTGQAKRLIQFYDNARNKIGEIYFTLIDYDRLGNGNEYYFSTPVKIDRSEYVYTEIQYETIYVNQVEDFKSFFTVVRDGVTQFFSVEIFDGFTLGSLLNIVLAMCAFIFMLHLIAK